MPAPAWINGDERSKSEHPSWAADLCRLPCCRDLTNDEGGERAEGLRQTETDRVPALPAAGRTKADEQAGM